ncbi:hypothetical protein [Streptacidiphilus melanogenes]|uniref:hypothetical protein n=1 Tax=Streptacidiphilus melanogenes TaxID=411235 RepID=UPI0005AB1191|nr:hypothetical protein [Streptacidiphilus melanogenes]
MTQTWQAETQRARGADLPQLTALVGDADRFLSESWALSPVRFHGALPPKFLTAEQIWSMLDGGPLLAPYAAVLREGAAVPAARWTKTRVVLQRPMPGYVDGAAVRELFDEGHTVQLERADHWHAELQRTAAGLGDELGADVRASVVLAPAGAVVPVVPGAAHLFLVQLGGASQWTVEGPGTDPVALHPGDTLYVPDRRAEVTGRVTAEATDGGSLLLVLRVLRSSPLDLARRALNDFLAGERADRIAGTHHYLTPAEKVAWLREELTAHLSMLDAARLAADTLDARRRSGGA